MMLMLWYCDNRPRPFNSCNKIVVVSNEFRGIGSLDPQNVRF
jgi:hypothetical protein